MKPNRIALSVAAAALLFGCRGQTSEKPPLWIKHGMEFQNKLLPYGRTTLFPDGRNMQRPPEGTVAVGFLKEDGAYWRGGEDTAHYVAKSPLRLTPMVMERGQERFNIYCTPCHSRTGAGGGMVVQKGFTPASNLTEERIAVMADGQLFHTITIGVRTMPSYGKQIPEEDRWAIVAYIRALQRSQRASINDVPENERANLR